MKSNLTRKDTYKNKGIIKRQYSTDNETSWQLITDMKLDEQSFFTGVLTSWKDQQKEIWDVNFGELCVIIKKMVDKKVFGLMPILKEKEINLLYEKIERLNQKYCISKAIFTGCTGGIKLIWYIEKNEFMTLENNTRLKFSFAQTKFEDIRNFVSWSIKRHHNELYNSLNDSLSFIEKVMGVKDYEKNNLFFDEYDMFLIQKYLIPQKGDSIQTEKAVYINCRYLLYMLLEDQKNKNNFYNLLINYRVHNKSKISTNQIKRYIKEIMFYFRLLYIYQILLDKSLLQTKNKDWNKFLKEIFKPQKGHIPLCDLKKIAQLSSNISDKIITILNKGDQHYNTTIFGSSFLLSTIIKDMYKFTNENFRKNT